MGSASRRYQSGFIQARVRSTVDKLMDESTFLHSLRSGSAGEPCVATSRGRTRHDTRTSKKGRGLEVALLCFSRVLGDTEKVMFVVLLLKTLVSTSPVHH